MRFEGRIVGDWLLTFDTKSCILKPTLRRFYFVSAHTNSCSQGGKIMGTYPLETTIREWANGKLTTEQAIGQILQLIQQMKEEIAELEARIYRCEQARKS